MEHTTNPMPEIYGLMNVTRPVDRDTNQPAPFIRLSVGVLPGLNKLSVKVPVGGCAVTNEQIQAKMQVGQVLLVRLEGFHVEKAWAGFNGNRDGYTFAATKVVPVGDKA